MPEYPCVLAFRVTVIGVNGGQIELTGGAMLDRAQTQMVQRFGSLVIDRDIREVTVDGNIIHLTNAEYTLLTVLAEHPRRAFSSEHLMRLLTRSEWVGDTHALQSHVSRLRAKLGKSGIQPRQVVTVHGYGYRFVPEPTQTLSSAVGADGHNGQQVNGDSVAYVLLNFERSIVWASPGIHQLLGWQMSDIEGTNLYNLVHADDLLAAFTAREELNAGYATALMVRMRTATGEYCNIEVLARPIIGRDGSIILFLSEYRPAPPDWTGPDVTPSAIRVDLKRRLENDPEGLPPANTMQTFLNPN
jgi:DNA-binding winged helix-turn-helix (wHTH) protein